MTRSTTLTALALIAIASTANAGIADFKPAPQVAPKTSTITCPTDKYIFEMAVTELSSKTITDKDGNEHFDNSIQVTVTDSKSGQVVETFSAVDATDPWEASWPVYQSEAPQFTFYAQDDQGPTALEYRGESLASQARSKCTSKAWSDQ